MFGFLAPLALRPPTTRPLRSLRHHFPVCVASPPSRTSSTLPNYPPSPDTPPLITLHPPLQYTTPDPGTRFSFVRYLVDDFITTPVFSNLTGSGVRVAVLDTGVDPTHPALKNRVDLSASRNWTNEDGGDERNVRDGQGHGTHCAGIIAAEAREGLMYGVAPECEIIVEKVLPKGGERPTGDIPRRIGKAIDHAVEQGADVISMSLGVPEKYFGRYKMEMAEMYTSVMRALAEGVVIVAAAGNDGRADVKNTIEPPGLYGGVVTVASHDDTGMRSVYSSYGGELDFMAPGEVFSTWPTYLPYRGRSGNEYEALRGTSMACPLVAGLAALFKQAGRMKSTSSLSPLMQELLSYTQFRARNNYETRELLRLLAERPDEHRRDDGYGRLIKAYDYVSGEFNGA